MGNFYFFGPVMNCNPKVPRHFLSPRINISGFDFIEPRMPMLSLPPSHMLRLYSLPLLHSSDALIFQGHGSQQTHLIKNYIGDDQS